MSSLFKCGIILLDTTILLLNLVVLYNVNWYKGWGGGGYGEGATLLGRSGAFVHGCLLFVSSESRIDVLFGGGGGYPSRFQSRKNA